MYNGTSNKWTKHFDFIIVDVICINVAFFLATLIYSGSGHMYNTSLYRNVTISVKNLLMQSCQLHERSSSLSKALPHYFYLTDSITFRFVTNYTSATRSSSNAHSQPH